MMSSILSFFSLPRRWGLFGALLLLALLTACPTPTPSDCDGVCKDTEECVQGEFCLPKCTPEETRCGAKCYDIKKEAAHCGACDNACKDGESCSEGKCGEATKCADGETACGDKCVTTDTSAEHCGACDNACKDGESCKEGKCGEAAKCADGEKDCGGICVDVASSDDHCGGCDNACGAGKACNSGKCECSGGQTACGDTCVDTDSSDDHCGKCDTKCSSPQYCDVGACVCPSGQTACGDKCVATDSSDDHCGACDNKCPSGTTCDSGKCGCSGGKALCGDKCIDTDTDTDNCGACDNKCETDETCDAGTCKAKGCESGKTDCSGTCVDTQADATNCGKCGEACKTGETCDAGVCKVGCQSPKKECSGACVDTDTDDKNCGACGTACNAGETCNSGKCGTTCASPKTVCSGACVDTDTDDQNCGSCGSACPSGETCSSGKCAAPCAAPKKVCSGACIDVQSDDNNCGACGTVCQAGEVCNVGKCRSTWVAQLSGTSHSYAQGIATNSKGMVYIAGLQPDAQSKPTFFLNQIDSTGKVKSLSKGYQAPIAFHVGISGQTIKTTSFTVIKGWRTSVSGSKGLFSLGGAFNTSTGVFTAPVAGYYHFTGAATFVNATAGSSVDRFTQIAIVLNGVSTPQISGTGTFQRDPKSTAFSMHAEGVFKLAKGDKVTLEVRATQDNDYNISNSGGLSGVYLGPTLEGFQVQHGETLSVSSANSTATIKKWLDSAPGAFSSSNLNKTTGIYTVPSDGRYYFSSRVIAHNVQQGGEFVASISQGTSLNARRDIHSRSTQITNKTFPLAMGGVLSLKKGDKIRVLVSSNDPSYDILKYSGFTGYRLPGTTPGFFVGLLNGQSVTSLSWTKVKGYRTDLPGMYRSTSTFSTSGGDFTAPVEGYYQFQGGVSLLKVSHASNSGDARVLFGINGDTSINQASSGLLRGSPAKDFMPVYASTMLYLQKGDKVAMYVQASKDISYSVGVASYFSGSLVGVKTNELTALRLASDASDNLYVAIHAKGLFSLGGVFNVWEPEGRTFIAHRRADGVWLPTRAYSTDEAGDIHSDGKGKLILCGQFQGAWTYNGSKKITAAGGRDSYVAKIGPGNTSADWALQISTTNADTSYIRCITTPSGAVYVKGRAKGKVTLGSLSLPADGTNYYYYLARVKADGSGFEWVKAFTGSINTNAIAADANDNVYTYGGFDKSAKVDTQSLTSSNREMLVTAFDMTGKLLWTQQSKVDTGASVQMGPQMAVDANGVVHIGGALKGAVTFGSTKLTSTGAFDVFVGTLDNKGNWGSAKILGGTAEENNPHLIIGPSGNRYILGQFRSSSLSVGGTTLTKKGTGFDLFILKNLP